MLGTGDCMIRHAHLLNAIAVAVPQMECTEEAVPTAVYIHNALNEQAWKEILEYEQLHKEYGCFSSAKEFCR